MRKLTGAGVALGLLLGASTASAQEFSRQGDIAFAADRLMGFYFFDEGPDGTVVSLGASPAVFAHPYTTARFGFDFFVIDHLSVGGTFAFWHAEADSGPFNDNDVSGFMLYPRVGYVFNFDDVFGVWLRGGLTIRNIEDNDEVALTFEVPFFAAPVRHFGFEFGPTIDLGLTGEDDEAIVIGIVTGGVFGWL